MNQNDRTRTTTPDIPNRRTEANRANAQHSTGPRTDAGKSITRLNAVKTALTGRTVLLPDDDMDLYTQHLADWEAELQPVGSRETALFQAIADAYWRAERIVRLEFALYAQGRILFANQFAEHPEAAGHPDLQAHLIEAHTYLTYERQFRNLSVQETRLRRQRDKDHAALNELQRERKAAAAEREQALDEATKLYKQAQKKGICLTAADNGFVFSLAEIERNLEQIFGCCDDHENEKNQQNEENDIRDLNSRQTLNVA